MNRAILICLATTSSIGLASAPSAQDCPALPGVESIVSPQATRFVIFGEVHGTAEGPVLFGDAVCHAAAAGPVVVALEIEADQQPVLDAFIRSDGSAAARATLLAIHPWSPGDDGRGSAAMLALVERLRVLRVGGADLRLVASVGSFRLPFNEYHELGIAAAWAHAASASPNARVFALVGRVHAARSPMYDLDYRPAAALLPSAEVTSLLIDGHPGEAWNMRGGVCGPSPAGSSQSRRGIRLTPTMEGRFNGEAAVGAALTASPPANGRTGCAARHSG